MGKYEKKKLSVIFLTPKFKVSNNNAMCIEHKNACLSVAQCRS